MLLPKFQLQTSLNLNEPVIASGLTDIFSQDKCDLSLLAKDSNYLFVSSFVQKSFVEVNEKGTKAAAGIVKTSCRAGPLFAKFLTFHCNKPFLFAITDDLTRLAIFTGRVMDLSAT